MSTSLPASDKHLEIEAFIDDKLAKARSALKSTDLLTAIVLLGIAVVGYVLLFVVADQWIPGGLPVALRWVLLLGWLSLVAGWVVGRLILPSWRAINSLYAAKEIERAEPALRSNLLNLVDLKAAGRTIDPSVLRAIERQAATRLAKLDVQSAVDHRPFVRSAYVLVALLTLLALYALFSPKRLGPTLLRMIPLANVAASTRTEILEIRPGDVQVSAGSRLEIQVDVGGQLPPSVRMLYTSVDLQFRDEPFELRPETEGSNRFRGDFGGPTGQGLLQTLTYVIEAGDDRSAPMTISVVQPPSATVDKVQLVAPSYTRLLPREIPGGAISAWEGTSVTLHATANRPVASARVEFLDKPEGQPTGEEIPLQVRDGRQISGTWKLQRRSDGSSPSHYQVSVRTENKETSRSPTIYPLTIRPDMPPEVAIVDPKRDLTAAANATIPLAIAARDADFELAGVRVQVEKAGEVIYSDNLFVGSRREVSLRHDFALQKLGVKAGEVLKIWAEAVDNRQPLPNRSQSAQLTITIEEPVTPEQAQQQLAEEKAAQQERLEQARQPEQSSGEDGDERSSPDEGADMPDNTQPKDQPSPDETNPEKSPQPTEDRNNPQEDTEPGKEGGEAGNAGEGTDGKSQQGGSSEEGKKSNDPQAGKSESPQFSPDGADDADVLNFLNEQLNRPEESAEKTPASTEGSDNPKPASPTEGENPPSSPPNEEMPEASDMPKGSEQSEKSEEKDAAAGKKPAPQNNDDKTPVTEKKPAEPSSETPSPPNKSANQVAPEPKQAPGKEPSAETAPDKSGKPGESMPPEPMPGETRPSSEKSSPETDGKNPNAPAPMPKPENPGSPKPPEKGAGETPMDKTPPADTREMPDSQPQNAKPQNNESSNTPPDKNNTPSDAPGETMPSSKNESTPPNGEQPKPSETPMNSGKPSPSEGEKGMDSATPSPNDSPAQKGMPSDQPPQNGASKMPPEPSESADGTKSTQKPMTDSQDKPAQSDAPDGQDPADKGTTKPSQKGGEQSRTAPKNPPKVDPSQRPSQKEDGAKPQQPNPMPTSPDKAESDSGNPSESPDGAPDDSAKPGSEKSANPKDSSSQGKKGAEGKGSPQNSDKPSSDSKPSQEGKNGDSAKPDAGMGASGMPDSGEKPDSAPSKKDEGQNDSKPASQENANPDSKETDNAGKPEDRAPNEDMKSDQAKPKEADSPQESKQGGEKEGQGSDDSGKKGDQPGKQASPPEGGKGAPSGNGKGGSAPGKSEAPGDGQGARDATTNDRPQGGGQGGGAMGSGSGSASAEGATGDAAKLEHNREAADLVLKKLQDQLKRGDVDPELLEKLGWNEADVQKFVNRMQEQLESAPPQEETPADAARREQFEEMLKSLNLRKSSSVRKETGAPARNIRQIDTRRAPVPSEYRDTYEAFTRELSRQPAPSR